MTTLSSAGAMAAKNKGKFVNKKNVFKALTICVVVLATTFFDGKALSLGQSLKNTAVQNLQSLVLPKGMSMLSNIGQRYMNWIIDFSKSNPKEFTTTLNSLFVPQCRKIVNWKPVSENRDQLMAQMNQSKKDFGKHTIQPCRIAASQEENLCTIQFLLTDEKGATYVITSMLICDQQGMIKEINEVYNQVGADN